MKRQREANAQQSTKANKKQQSIEKDNYKIQYYDVNKSYKNIFARDKNNKEKLRSVFIRFSFFSKNLKKAYQKYKSNRCLSTQKQACRKTSPKKAFDHKFFNIAT